MVLHHNKLPWGCWSLMECSCVLINPRLHLSPPAATLPRGANCLFSSEGWEYIKYAHSTETKQAFHWGYSLESSWNTSPVPIHRNHQVTARNLSPSERAWLWPSTSSSSASRDTIFLLGFRPSDRYILQPQSYIMVSFKPITAKVEKSKKLIPMAPEAALYGPCSSHQPLHLSFSLCNPVSWDGILICWMTILSLLK